MRSTGQWEHTRSRASGVYGREVVRGEASDQLFDRLPLVAVRGSPPASRIVHLALISPPVCNWRAHLIGNDGQKAGKDTGHRKQGCPQLTTTCADVMRNPLRLLARPMLFVVSATRCCSYVQGPSAAWAIARRYCIGVGQAGWRPSHVAVALVGYGIEQTSDRAYGKIGAIPAHNR